MKEDNLQTSPESVAPIREETVVVHSSASQGELSTVVQDDVQTDNNSFAEVNAPLEKNKSHSFLVNSNPIGTEQESESRSKYELPNSYGDNRVVLMVRDPFWLFAYWDVSESTRESVRNAIGANTFNQSRQTVRVYEIANRSESNGAWFDIPTDGYTMNWYINVPSDDKGYVVEVGYVTPDNRFIVMGRSNPVHTPPASISDILDEEWLALDEDFFRLYRLGGAMNMAGSEEIIRGTRGLSLRLEQEMGSGAVSSISSPFGGRPGVPENFWMVLDAELIIYGKTEPSAHVTVGETPVKLESDGSFSTRFNLPDGKYVLPVEAVSQCGSHRIVITPTVTRETH